MDQWGTCSSAFYVLNPAGELRLLPSREGLGSVNYARVLSPDEQP